MFDFTANSFQMSRRTRPDDGLRNESSSLALILTITGNNPRKERLVSAGKDLSFTSERRNMIGLLVGRRHGQVSSEGKRIGSCNVLFVGSRMVGLYSLQEKKKINIKRKKKRERFLLQLRICSRLFLCVGVQGKIPCAFSCPISFKYDRSVGALKDKSCGSTGNF